MKVAEPSVEPHKTHTFAETLKNKSPYTLVRSAIKRPFSRWKTKKKKRTSL